MIWLYSTLSGERRRCSLFMASFNPMMSIKQEVYHNILSLDVISHDIYSHMYVIFKFDTPYNVWSRINAMLRWERLGNNIQHADIV